MIVTGWLLIVLGVGAHGPIWHISEVRSQQSCFEQRDALVKEAKEQRAIVSIVCEPVLKLGKRA